MHVYIELAWFNLGVVWSCMFKAMVTSYVLGICLFCIWGTLYLHSYQVKWKMFAIKMIMLKGNWIKD